MEIVSKIGDMGHVMTGASTGPHMAGQAFSLVRAGDQYHRLCYFEFGPGEASFTWLCRSLARAWVWE